MADNKAKNKFTIKVRRNLPNELHFEVQRRTRAASFKDRKQYTRKPKHKKDLRRSDSQNE